MLTHSLSYMHFSLPLHFHYKSLHMQSSLVLPQIIYPLFVVKWSPYDLRILTEFTDLQIQKAGSVGRSIDVSSFKTYDELRSEIERMFGLEGLLNDTRGSGWKLVYVDYENDVLLVGDDPWE